jgi:plastocyanin
MTIAIRAALSIGFSLALFGCAQPSTSSPTAVDQRITSNGLTLGAAAESLSNSHHSATMKFHGPDEPVWLAPKTQKNFNITPRRAVVRAGDAVTFDVSTGGGGIYTVAIYDNGIEPEDINSNLRRVTGCPGVPLLPGLAFINDPAGRLAIFTPPCAGGPTAPSYTFTQPGEYLVISAYVPHFQQEMWAWVVVKE